MNRKKVTIYTDGACSGNPGKGGWGAILMFGNIKREMSGAEQETTNNRMELTAVIKALEALKEPCDVDLYSDSAYVVNAFLQDWISGWKAKGWRGSDKKPVKNLDLWLTLIELTETHNVNFVKVKGHSGIEGNEEADMLAKQAVGISE